MTLRRIICLVAIFLLTPVLSLAKVYLVSVGVADNASGYSDLALPVNDAKVIVEIYKQSCDDIQCFLLLNERATVSEVKSVMNLVFECASPDDDVIFYFSGHAYSGAFVLYDRRISHQEVAEAMRGQCRKKMIFADTCFSGKIRAVDSSGERQPAGFASDVLVFVSSREGETSLGYHSMNNGLFTACLYRGLRGGADSNNDRKITAKELFVFVYEHVVRISNGRQHPVMWGNFSDNMVIIEW